MYGNRIIGRRVSRDLGCQFLVQWEGQKLSKCTWEDANAFESPSSVNMKLDEVMKPIPGAKYTHSDSKVESIEDAKQILQLIAMKDASGMDKRPNRSSRNSKLPPKQIISDDRKSQIVSEQNDQNIFSCELINHRFYIINYVSTRPAYINSKFIDRLDQELSDTPQHADLCCLVLSHMSVETKEKDMLPRQFLQSFQKLRKIFETRSKPLILYLKDVSMKCLSVALLLFVDRVVCTENTSICIFTEIENEFYRYLVEELIIAYGFTPVKRMIFSETCMNSSTASQLGFVFQIFPDNSHPLDVCEDMIATYGIHSVDSANLP